ncbi:serine/arginine repetitive matrix protein 1-like [Drosophila sechellia]|uniref:serine/arginine repetitive matrix protein 1-like n=1 Tax=Drosophila sechellia TaxID=7238 RepID=UPI0013DE1444|nr:serine/arginine repetitive matrix protein 1-like [Drosophila sechellia]
MTTILHHSCSSSESEPTVSKHLSFDSRSIGRHSASSGPPHSPRPCPCRRSAWSSPCPCPRSTRSPSVPRARDPRRSPARPSTRSHSACTESEGAAPQVAQDVTQSKHSEICAQVDIEARTSKTYICRIHFIKPLIV